MEDPKSIIDVLIRESKYEQKLLRKNVMRKGKELREAGLLEDGEKVSSLFDDDEQICALAGEAYMKEIKTEKVESIEKQLSNIAKAINEEWKKRNTLSPFEIAVQ